MSVCAWLVFESQVESTTTQLATWLYFDWSRLIPSKKMWLMVKHFFMAYFNCYILVATSWQPDHGWEVTVQNSPPMTSFLAVRNNNYKHSYYCWKSNYLKWKYSNSQKNPQGLLRVVWGLLRTVESCSRVVEGVESCSRVVEDCWELLQHTCNWSQLVRLTLVEQWLQLILVGLLVEQNLKTWSSCGWVSKRCFDLTQPDFRTLSNTFWLLAFRPKRI